MGNLSVLQGQLKQAAMAEEREAKKYDVECQKVFHNYVDFLGSS